MPSAIARGLAQLCNPQTNYVTKRSGRATRATWYKINFLATIRSTSFREVLEKKCSPQTELLLEKCSTSFGEVLPTENTAVARAALASDFDGALLRLIDRVFSAKALSFDGATIARYRGHLHGLMQAFGRDDDNHPFSAQHVASPPTDNQVAMLLTVADEPRIARLLQTIFTECRGGAHPMYSYMWFPFVALQRIHGVSIERQKQARAALAIAKKTSRQHQAEQLTLDDDANAGDMQAVIGALARKKAMR